MIHNQHLRLSGLVPLYTAARTLAWYVVPQEYGTRARDKVEIGTRIGAAMLAKLRTDLIAIMDVGKHEDERVHQPDHSRRAMDPSLFVGSPPPSTSHVRTRLYFTSESHIYSLFNVLRWGTSTGKAILSAAGQSRLTDVELGYLTHIVFRVLAKRPPRKPAKPSADADLLAALESVREGRQVESAAAETDHAASNQSASNDSASNNSASNNSASNNSASNNSASAYVVQILVSPGIDHHQVVCDWSAIDARDGARAAPRQGIDALSAAQEVILASSPDLTLEEVDQFLSHVLALHESQQAAALGAEGDELGRPNGSPQAPPSQSSYRSEESSPVMKR